MKNIDLLSSDKTTDYHQGQPILEKRTYLIRALNQYELQIAVELAWELSKDPANRSYPLFQSRDEIRAEYVAGLRGQNAALLGCFQSERLIGLLCYFFQPGEHYLQTTSFIVAEDYDAVADEFVKYLRTNFKEYEIYIGITAENICAAKILRLNGYELIEASLDMRLGKSQFIEQDSPDHEIIRIDRTNLEEYARFHKAHFDDIYWNVERLRKNIDQWTILALKTQGKISGGLFLRIDADSAEIFGMAFAGFTDAHVASALLARALKTVFEENPGVDSVVFFTDEDEKLNQSAALSNGFRCHSRYQCYRNA